MLDDENAAILETSVIAYDAIFSELGPEARESFRDTVQTYLESGIAIPEVKAISKATNYSNWNYNLVKSLKAKIAGNDLTGEDEEDNQPAQLAEFIAKDLKIVGKLVSAIEQQYADGQKADSNEQFINSIKGSVTDDLSKLQADLEVLRAQYGRLSDPTHSDFDSEAAANIREEIYRKNLSAATAETLQAKLETFKRGDEIESHTEAHAEYLQRRIDALEKTMAEKQAEYTKYQQENYTGSEDFANAVKFEMETLAEEKVDLLLQKETTESFAEYDSTVRTASLKAGVNLLSTAQASAAFAVKPDNTPEGHATNSLFLGEAVGSALGDILDAAGHLKVAKGFKGAAALSLVGGAAGSFVPTAKLLADPNLDPETRKVVQAEVGLQGTALAFAAVENMLGIAELAVKAGSKAANVLGKAVPVIGAIGSVVGAINPAKWAEFDQKQDRVDAIQNADTYSSGLLGDLLQESKDAEAAFYGVTTSLDVVTGVTSGVLAATGVGAPIAAAVGLIGGAISAIVGAFEQVALEGIADKYAKKIRTAENGETQTVEEFFEGSFDQKQEKTKAHYTDFFNDLVAEDDIDQVIALGGQGLDATDIELAAITKTSGELNKTARNYVETFTDSGWQTGDRSLTPTEGEDINVISLPDANGAKSYLTYTTPLYSAGTGETSREKTGKNAYQTTLKITDLSGWNIRDFGNNQTTFNMSKVVSSAQDRFGNSMEVGIEIDAAGGDDTLFAYESQITFDGGSGNDTASYSRLSDTELTGGVRIAANSANTLVVEKNLKEGSKYYQESIESQTISHGKRTEVVQMRKVGLEDRSGTHNVIDRLSNIEIIHGSRLDDEINVDLSSQVKQVFGFGGDDQIKVGESIEIVGGGAGDDRIQLEHTLLEKFWGGQKAELYIDGGEGHGDTLVFDSETITRLLDELDADQIRAQTAEEIAELLIPVASADRAQEVAKTANSLTNILQSTDDTALKKLTVFNTEVAHVNLKSGGAAGEMVVHSLSSYRDAVNNAVTNLNSDNSVTDLDISVSAAGNTNAVAILGSEFNDIIRGSQNDDYLFGGGGNDVFDLTGIGQGNDILVGGSGFDVFNFAYYDDMKSGGHHLITGPEVEDVRGDVVNLTTSLRDEIDVGYFRYEDDLVVSFDSDTSVTIDGFFSSGAANSNIGVRYGNKLENIHHNPHNRIYGAEAEEGNTDPNTTFYFNFIYNGSRDVHSFSPGGDDGNYYYSANYIDGDVGTVRDLTGPAHADDEAYLAEFRQNYISFRNSNDVWMTHQATDDLTSFSEALDQALDKQAGGAVLTESELFDLKEIISIKETVRTTSDGTNGANVIDGTLGNDVINGLSGADVIDGKAGNDIIDGGLDVDTLDGGAGFDLYSREDYGIGIKFDLRRSQHEEHVRYHDSSGEEVLLSSAGTYTNFEGVIGTRFDDKLIGNSDSNYLEGGAGADTISGKGGNDVIHGGDGQDVLDGGAGFDVASYKGAAFAIRFELASSDPDYDQKAQYWNGSQWLQGDIVSNFEGVVGTGHADILTGNGGDNYFEGGAGNDRIEGGAGNDFINGGEGIDILDGGDGFDILSYEDHSQAVRIRLEAESSELIAGTGNYVAGDSISGFEGVIGTSFDDDLRGTSDRNILEGGAGDDFLQGGAGFDTFVFRTGHGLDRITDFTVGEDQLMFDIAGSMEDIEVSVIESANRLETYTRIQTGDGNLIDLFGVDVADLTANSFVFV